MNPTNDAWVGDTAGPAQHLAMARLRAVELRVPIVRVASTGISAIIDADGSLRSETALFEAVTRIDTLRWLRTETVYSRHGDVLVLACVLWSAAAFAYVARRTWSERGDSRPRAPVPSGST